MKKNETFRNQFLSSGAMEAKNDPDGYPIYPETEDIYHKWKKEKSIDPDHILKFNEKDIPEIKNNKDFNDDVPESEPEIAESETEEIIGMEDDENTYFMLGSDDPVDREANLVN